MTKPIFRWIVGNVNFQGLNILKHSVKEAKRIYGERFEWIICHNNIDPSSLPQDIKLIEQKWSDCPIPIIQGSPMEKEGGFELFIYKKNKHILDTRESGGSTWKICPARLDQERHEIVMDNDIVLTKPLDKIEQFLNSSKPLLLESKRRYFGKYDKLFPKTESFNSGLMGFPPHFDFGVNLKHNWRTHGPHTELNYADEQGLLTYTLKKQKPIIVDKNEIKELLFDDELGDLDACGYHFIQANRMHHYGWNEFKQLKLT